MHAPVGKTSFDATRLIENAHALVDSIVKAKPPAAKGKYLKSITVSSTMGPGRRDRYRHIDRACRRQQASTGRRAWLSRRAKKRPELEGRSRAAFKGAETAILVDYRGLNVPQVTELRRQLRAVKAQYKVVKNTLAKRAMKGTAFEPLDEHFEGTTAVAYTGDDPVALAKTLTTFAKGAPALQIKAAVVQGRAIRPARSPSSRTCRASRSCTPSCCSCCRRRWCSSSAC